MFDGNLFFVAGEGVLYKRLVGLGRNQAYHGHDHQSREHCQRAAVNGRLQQRREELSCEQVEQHKTRAENEADPAGELGCLFPVQTVQEGSQERARQRAPRYAHQLRDELDAFVFALRLVNRDKRRDGDKDDNENTDDEHLLFLVHLLDDVALEQVDGQGGGRGDNQRGQGGHGRRQHQDDHHRDQKGRKSRQHLRNDRVKAVLGNVNVEQSAEAAEEVAAARHDQRERGGDNGALLDISLVLDGVELLHHLGQAPGAQRGQDDDAQQTERIGSEEGVERARNRGGARVLHLGKTVERFHEAALIHKHRRDDRHNADDHDNALDEVVDRRRHVAARDNIDTRQHAHGDDAPDVVDVERHAEQTGKTVVKRGGVGNQENKGDDGSADLESLAVKALAEELGHGRRVEVLGHNAGASAQNHPCQQRADQGVADADPGGRDAELPAELSRVADKDNRGKVGGAVGERRQPRTDASAAQHKAVDVGGVLAAVNAHADHDAEEQHQHDDFNC